MPLNKGQTELEILQNRFTSYISTAIQRRRNDYIRQALRYRQTEVEAERIFREQSTAAEFDIWGELPLLMCIENNQLLCALKAITEREREIFFARVLDGKSFEELAVKFGLGYKGVTAVYYRAIKKIRERMEKNGF